MIYEDERGNVHAYVEQLMNCNDCVWTTEIPVDDEDGELSLLWPRKLFYEGTDYYTLQLRFEFSNTTRRNTRVDCRLQTCVDLAGDEETTMRFPVGR